MTTLVLVLRSFENKVFVLSCLSYTATLLKATSPRHSGPWLHWTVEWPFTSLHLRRWPTATCHLPPADELENVVPNLVRASGDSKSGGITSQDQDRERSRKTVDSVYALFILFALRNLNTTESKGFKFTICPFKCFDKAQVFENSQRSLTWKHTRHTRSPSKRSCP